MGVLQAQLLDLFVGLINEVGVKFHAIGIGQELLRGHDDDAAIPAAEIIHALAWLKAGEIEHFLDDHVGRRVVRGELLDLFLRRVLGGCDQTQDTKRQRNFMVPHTGGLDCFPFRQWRSPTRPVRS